MEIHAFVASLALEHHGIVTRRMLRNAGVSTRAIDRWVASARFEVVVPGVYRVFDADPELQRISLAVLSVKNGAADLETAAELHGIPVHHTGLPRVVVPHGGTNRSGLARVRQTRALPVVDVCAAQNIRCLTLARTVCELIPRLSAPAAERLTTRALSSGGLSESELTACDQSMARQGRPGVQKRRDRLAPLLVGATADLSFLERMFLTRYQASGLPPLEVQFRPPWFDGVQGVVDFALPEQRLIVEVDGRAWHDSVDARLNDARRDRRAERHGWRVVRFGWDEVSHRWSEVVGHLGFVVDSADPPRSA